MSALNDRGVNLVANALAQSTDHILSFFQMLRTELAFYVGCLNLHAQLADMEEPMCFPVPAPAGERKLSFSGLYDVSLALSMGQKVVGNDLNADHRDLIIITGANTGGKSTFLRSVGLAHLMMQAGMFVSAKSFSSEVCDGIFTHYKREEDATMESGKWDEELSRMSEIVDNIKTNSLLLFNELFASTNEREGSEIARQIAAALMEKGVKILFVTHLYEFAHRFHDSGMENVMFLRAERRPTERARFGWSKESRCKRATARMSMTRSLAWSIGPTARRESDWRPLSAMRTIRGRFHDSDTRALRRRCRPAVVGNTGGADKADAGRILPAEENFCR